MSFLEAIILGLVEGATEFLPISSTAHLVIVSKILTIPQGEFLKSFEIVIQLGAIAAVVLFFRKRLVKDFWLWKKVAVAFFPTALIGFLLYKVFKAYLIGNLGIALWSLAVGGAALIVAEKFFMKKAGATESGKVEQGKVEQSKIVDGISNLENLSTKQAFIIGTIQSLAIIPGVSRAAATIVPSLFFGLNRKAATEFSFLLAIPTVAAASGYDILKNFSVLKHTSNVSLLAVGFIVSFLAALLSIKFLLNYITNHSFTSFGIYRILVAIAAGAFFLLA